MTCVGEATFRATETIAKPGAHRIEMTCGGDDDRINLIVHGERYIPERRLLPGLGTEAHAVGAWPIAGIDGLQFGLTNNGGPPDA